MCDFPDMHKYIEDKLGRPVWTHEMAKKDMQEEIRKAVYPDFIALCRHKDGGQEEIPAGPYDLLYEEGGPDA